MLKMVLVMLMLMLMVVVVMLMLMVILEVVVVVFVVTVAKVKLMLMVGDVAGSHDHASGVPRPQRRQRKERSKEVFGARAQRSWATRRQQDLHLA